MPTRIYFSGERSRAKVEIALARGKDLYDKRETIKKRDMARDVQRELRECREASATGCAARRETFGDAGCLSRFECRSRARTRHALNRLEALQDGSRRPAQAASASRIQLAAGSSAPGVRR